MIVGIADGHFPDIVQGEAKIFQKEDLLKPGKIFICVKTCSGFCNQGRFEDILFIIIADSTQGHMSHAGKFAGRVVAVFFHGK